MTVRKLTQVIDACIIDLDGTQVDTLGDFEVALGRMLAELQLPPVARDFIERAVGKGSEHLIRSVLAEQMLPFDHELLLGLRRDARFGPVLTIARGGVEAELDPDAVNLLLPATAEDILAALGRLRSAKLLRGFRGKPGVDMDALASRIHQICEWFSDQPLREVEINPLAIRGNEVWALDALITPMAGAN